MRTTVQIASGGWLTQLVWEQSSITGTTWNNSVPVVHHMFDAHALRVVSEADLRHLAEVVQSDLIERAVAQPFRRRAR